MATLEELVLKLTLDNEEFKKRLGEMQDTLKRTAEATERSGAKLEDAARRIGGSFSRLRNEVIAVGSALIGFTGLSNFVSQTTRAEMSIGLLAKNIGIAVEELDAWGGAAKRFGGSTEATQATFQGLVQQFQQFSLTGQSQVLPYFRALGVQMTDAAGKMRPLRDIMLDLSDRFHNMDPARANAFGRALGLDQGTINLLMQGRQEVEKYLEQQRQLGLTTKADAEAGMAFQRSLMDIQQAAQRLGQTILTELTPEIVKVVDELTKWIQANKEWLAADIEEEVKKAASAVVEFGKGVDAVVQFLGGWKNVTEALFALWLGSKFLAALNNVVKLATALSIIPGSGVTASMLGRLSVLGIPLMLGGDTGPMTDEDKRKLDERNKEEEEKYRRDHPNFDPSQAESMGTAFRRWWGNVKGFLGVSDQRSDNTGGASDARLAAVRDRLSADLGISKDAASGLVSNLNAESGIQGIQERNPVAGRGGFGWAQWTGPRRVAFEQFATDRRMDPASDEANYAFLLHELQTKYPGVLAQLRSGQITATQAADIVFKDYEGAPGHTRGGHIAAAERIARLPSTPMAPGNENVAEGGRPAWYHPTGAEPSVTNNNSASTTNNTNSTKTDINIGAVSVHSAANDANGISKDINASLRKYAFADMMNVGLS